MGAYVVWLWRRGVVHVATDVEVPIVSWAGNFLQRYAPGVTWHILKAVESGDDLLNMFRTQVILRTTGVKLGIGVDEEHLATAGVGFVEVRESTAEIRTHHQDASWDARAVEEIGWQADD